ncbi:uncharacterized protein BO80DRAFT_223507 [Aspergillus ibericus CBS 121593]|uniref:Uncharacterized protein n=1 Tax=Aspergillus ibericus CBS 121593 TaxID=1448316 RepID=A0A395GM24_9EURO|nr:hypothetical protein BO80DRAFT_223507 [Aspergillus ibericus CBS 121593]RAK96561.1 hypothetical protein BO80DRAFT_223507 [Aspergillus ibericus CBS 121593]
MHFVEVLGALPQMRTHISGNLFCLPEDCHDEFIRRLGYKGSYRDQQIQNIKDRGILDVQGRAVLDRLAADVFNFLGKRVKASIDDFITQCPESVLGQNLQQTRCFQIEQQIPKAVLQPGISTPNDRSSHTSDAAQEIRSDDETLLHTTHDSTATTYMSPAIAARLREPPSQSFDNATNQITGAKPRDESGSSDMRDILNVYDTLQPILSMQGCGSISMDKPRSTQPIWSTSMTYFSQYYQLTTFLHLTGRPMVRW